MVRLNSMRLSNNFSNYSAGIIRLLLFISNYIIPFGLLFVAAKVFQYLFITNWDRTILKSAKDGDLKLLLEAIRNRGNIETKQRHEVTPLMVAAINNHGIIVSSLISSGANVNARDDEGRVALMFAAQFGHVDIVKMLLAKGSNPNSMGFNGATALILAARKCFRFF
jgi:ankyrin repeat protein